MEKTILKMLLVLIKALTVKVITFVIELPFFLIGIVGYNVQFVTNKVDIKPTKDNLVDSVTLDNGEIISIHYIPDINKLGVYVGGIMQIHNKTVFVIDDIFNKLQYKMQQAILYHEIGHYVCGHMKRTLKDVWNQCVSMGKMIVYSQEKKNLLVENTINTRDYQKEIMADKYAVMKCGENSVIEYIMLMYYSIEDKDKEKATILELNERYKALTGSEL